MNAPSKFPIKQPGGPVRFNPSMERLDADEAKTIQGLIATMRYIHEKTFADGGHAIRSVHAKTHGILEGCLEVNADLPSDLALGLFATPGRYPVVMRFSTIPGAILDDSASTPRGLAVKIIGVKGERLSGSASGRRTRTPGLSGRPHVSPCASRLETAKADGAGESLSVLCASGV
jgi:hypothetical protein